MLGWIRMGVRAGQAPHNVAIAMLGVVHALGVGLSVILLHSDLAMAQISDPKPLVADIPDQSLAQALVNFTSQTGLQHVYSSEVISDQKTRGAPAGLAPTDALARLLQGTGLQYQFLNARIVLILGTAPPLLEEIVVTAHFVPKPPHVAPATAKELRLIEAANEELERRIVRNDLLYAHPALDLYLQGIAERLLAADTLASGVVRVRVIKGTEANAFALSNGSIYVTTALLASLDNEAELAAVLGHELTHYTNAHVLRALRDENHKSAVARVAGILLGAVLGVAEQRAGIQPGKTVLIPQETLEIWVRASVSGYSRDLEREADDGGIRRMIAAGYDASGALAALQRLAELPPADLSVQLPMYASHPRLAERIASYRALLAGELAGAVGSGREIRRAEYQSQIAELPLDQVAILLDAGALDRAETALVAVVATTHDSARAEFLEGEIARNRLPHTDATKARALAAYDRAVMLPEAPPVAFREQALLYRQLGNAEAARAAFRHYLERAPFAVDAPLVRRYLEESAVPAVALSAADR